MAKQIQAGKQNRSLLKLIDKYYADLADYARQHVLLEMGKRHAFHRLMADAGKPHGWTLIAEQEKKVGGKTIRPDGTFKDEMNLVRGYWEAKDTADNLDAEIEKKRKAGYPLSNIIFEDTQTAVLYQHGERILAVDMRAADKLAELVLQFFRYVEPEIEEFEQAVEEFKLRVPDLAEGLARKIEQAHRTNAAFKRAFADFFQLCQTSLNPNISQAAVDEMLIQHILTERLIREIFDNPEFVRRNVIAAEVEKVMLAMTSHSFDRNTYLRELDRFYVAIEHAARTMTDWSDKQYFLSTVYERFFQGYSVKLADTMGIVYTPQEIVDFMCASVAEVLEREFGKKLWSEDVYIIDPCTGTGNFIVNLIRRIPKAKLEDVYKHRLFANEIMLLPYYIAALSIERAYFEQMGRYEGFEGLCFVDTLDLAEHAQAELGFMTLKNTERVARQKESPITVVIGNPPYNSNQANENDKNKNRKYPLIDGRIRETYVASSSASLKAKSYDPYWRFLRWASDRLEKRDGIVCMITNNGFVEAKSADGLREHLRCDFDRIYHFDFKGNARMTGQRRILEGGNVFNDKIRAGVGVTVLVRRKGTDRSIQYHVVGDRWKVDKKLAYIKQFPTVSAVPWTEVVPSERGDWMLARGAEAYSKLLPLGTKAAKGSKGAVREALFFKYSIGVSSNRDEVVYDFNRDRLVERLAQFCEDYNGEVDRWKRSTGRKRDVDEFVNYERIKWSETLKRKLQALSYATFDQSHVRECAYRPFTKTHLYFDPLLVDRPGLFPKALPTTSSEAENAVICCTNHTQTQFLAQATRKIPDAAVGGRGGQCFPFYVYDEDGTNRRENITDWALNQFRGHYQDKQIDKWAIFHYVYGLLHHPGYREKFADNLKRELPRIPFAPDFRAFAEAGAKLARLHLDYEKLQPWELELVETPGAPLSYRVEDKMRLSKDKERIAVNPSLTLVGIPPEAFNYRLGNRSALEWVVDQYQVSTDKRSGITSDPNRDDDPQYIVRLVGQVIRVSMETVAIVNSLPAYSTENT